MNLISNLIEMRHINFFIAKICIESTLAEIDGMRKEIEGIQEEIRSIKAIFSYQIEFITKSMQGIRFSTPFQLKLRKETSTFIYISFLLCLFFRQMF